MAQFKKDCNKFVHDYRTQGPMVPGLAPEDASDRLIVAQVIFPATTEVLFFVQRQFGVHANPSCYLQNFVNNSGSKMFSVKRWITSVNKVPQTNYLI